MVARETYWKRAAVFTALLLAASAAAAFDIPPPPPPMYEGLIFPLYPNKPKTVTAKPQSRATDTRALSPSQVNESAKTLATQLPRDYRAKMVDIYQQSFDVFTQVEDRLELRHDDVANGLAAFIVGNYSVANDVDVPDENFVRIIPQIREGLLASNEFQQLSSDRKRQLYEQTSMVGTFMVIARMAFQKNPDAAAEANFRQTARANLETVLGRSPDDLVVDDRGLRFE